MCNEGEPKNSQRLNPTEWEGKKGWVFGVLGTWRGDKNINPLSFSIPLVGQKRGGFSHCSEDNIFYELCWN